MFSSAQSDRLSMAASLRNLLLITLLMAKKFLLTTGSPLGCPPNEHVQNKVCRADFVIKGTLREKVGTVEDYVIYTVVIKTQFTISKEFSLATEESLGETFVTKSLSERLNVGEKLVLSGRLSTLNGTVRMVTTECDWVEPWATVTQRQKSFLHKKLYETNCDCLVVNDLHTESPVACQLPSLCHGRLSFCTANLPDGHNKTKCRWSGNGDLRECLAEQN